LPRLLLTGLALLALLPGCGSSGSPSETTSAGGGEATVIPARENGAAAPDPSCRRQLGDFVDALGELRRRLAVGLSYHPYANRVLALKREYEHLPVDLLSIECLADAGTPSEKAFNRYIDAANTWGECLSTAGCTSVSIESKLQGQWRVASHFLGEAEAGLKHG
jgi:hypothetical protein